MKKIVVRLLQIFGIVGVLLLVIVAYVAATFNPNDYKPLIIKLVKEKKQRTLTIDGDIKLAFWPKLGADLGKVSISEHNGDKEFAGIRSAKVYLSIVPLLQKQLVVDTIVVDGIHANLIRFKDGTTNIDDLMSKEESSEEIKFDIEGVRVTHAGLVVDDQMSARHLAISDLALTTGHVAKNEPIDLNTTFELQSDAPSVEAKVQFKGNLLADTEHKYYVAKGLNVAVQGDVVTAKAVDVVLSGNVDAKPETGEILVDALKLTAKANLQGKANDIQLDITSLRATKDEVSSKEAHVILTQTQGDDKMTAKLTIADIKGSMKAFQSSGITGDFSGKQGERSVSGKFSSPFAGNLETSVFDLPKLAGEVDIKDPAIPRGEMKASFNFNAHADLKQQQLRVALDALMDGSKLNGKVSLDKFAQPEIKFDLTADQLDLNAMLGSQKPVPAKTTTAKPADLTALKNLRAQGNLNIGNIRYQKYQLATLALTIKADGQALTVSPLSVKLDDSQIKGSLGISQFEKPLYHFDLDIDRIDANRYIVADTTKPATPMTDDTPIDLSALKALNADGSLRIGSFKYGKVQSSNVRLDLKADAGQVSLNPVAANLYEGSVAGALELDARATPALKIRQEMKGVNIGPLMMDAINNDMLEGKGAVSLNLKTQGSTLGSMKKTLNGEAGLVLADGAVKGIDIAGAIRDIKSKLSFKNNILASDQKKKTDFSEMLASFKITDGVAHNDDLNIKSPLLRIGGSGDIDIGKQTINYTAKPTVVASLKGQGGSDISNLGGLTFPVKVTGTFAKPEYGIDFAGVASSIAQKNLLGNVAGGKGEAVQKLLSGDKAAALEGLMGTKNKAETPTSGAVNNKEATSNATAQDKPKPSAEEKVGKKLNKLLGL